MKRIFACLAITYAFLATQTAAKCDELAFKKFESRGGRFAIDLPGRPATEVKDHGEGFKEYSFYCPVSNALVFTVTYLDFPAKYVVGKDAQERMKTYRRGWRKGKEFSDDKAISHAKTKVPGRDYRLEAEPGFFVRERMYWDNGRLYCMYIGSENKADLDGKHATRFFDSFQIVR